MLLEEILEEFDVHCAANMKEAVAILERIEPCVVISDLSLPDVPRDEVVATIRRSAPKAPIILMSAIASQDLEEAAREQGADRIIPKPFELDFFETSLIFGCGKEQSPEPAATPPP